MSGASLPPRRLADADADASRAALQLTGSTTLLPHMQRVAEAYMRGQPASVVVNGGCGTMRGFKALLDGTTDIAMASAAIPADLAAAAAADGLAFHATVIRQDAILLVVHGSNPVDTLSLPQLRNIFTGRIDNWRGVGGADAAIEVLAGPPGGGISSSWRKLVLGDEDTFTPSQRVLAAGERLARVALRPNAIAYVAQAAWPARGLKVLRIGGLAADRAAQSYPLRAPMLLVTLGPAPPATARFIHYAASAHAAAGTGGSHE